MGEKEALSGRRGFLVTEQQIGAFNPARARLPSGQQWGLLPNEASGLRKVEDPLFDNLGRVSACGVGGCPELARPPRESLEPEPHERDSLKALGAQCEFCSGSRASPWRSSPKLQARLKRSAGSAAPRGKDSSTSRGRAPSFKALERPVQSGGYRVP